MKARIKSAALALIAALLPSISLAEDFVLSLPSPVAALVPLPSGQFLASYGSTLSRFNNDGTIDLAFNNFRQVTTLAVENDGSVLARDSFAIQRFDSEGLQQSEILRLTESLLLQPDGKMVIWGRPALLRLHPDGTLDQSFASNRLQLGVSLSGSRGFTLQEDGKIVIGTMDGALLRFNPDGSRDDAFNSPAFSPPWVSTVLAQPDGKILVGGNFRAAGESTRLGIARLNADGTLDSSFNPSSEEGTAVTSFALQANGKLIVAGHFDFLAGQPATNVVRLNPDGTIDPAFPRSFPVSWSETGPLALQEDGSVLVGISSNLLRIANPESASQSFAQEGSTLTWLRGGSSPEVSHTRFLVSSDGVIWNDLGSATRIAGGWRLEGASIPAGARLRVRGYITGTSTYVDFAPGAPAILSGPSDRTNNVNTTSILRVFAKGLEPLAFQWFKDGQAIAGVQSSTLVLSNVTGAAVGNYYAIVSNSEGSATSRVARLSVLDPVIFQQPESVWLNAGDPLALSINADGTGLTYQWNQNGQPIPGATAATLSIPSATSAQTGNYHVTLRSDYGTAESAIAEVHVNHALPDAWNPAFENTSEWFPLQTAVFHRNNLFLGGLFRILSPPGSKHLVRFMADGTMDPLFIPEPTGTEPTGVNTLSVAPNGQLMVGGTFRTIAGQPQAYLARLNTDGTLDPQFRPVFEGPWGGTLTGLYAIEFLQDGRILIAGDFSSVNGQPRPGVARLFPDGALDESFNPHSNTVPAVTWELLVQPDGKIILDGWDLRRLNADGTPDLAFTAAAFSNSFSSPFLLPNNQLLMSSRTGVSRVNPDGSIDANFTDATGSLEALQADGKFIVRRLIQIAPPLYHYVLLRFNPDGSADPSFSPVFDNSVDVKAMEPDGGFVLSGHFTSVAGRPIPRLAKLRNTEPASQSLTFLGDTATWIRSGTSPEVTRTIFEFSSNGNAWTYLGAGVRTPGGWQLSGLHLDTPGTLRTRGFLKGSIYEAAIEVPAGLKLTTTNYRPESRELVLNATAPGGGLVVLESSLDLKQWTSIQTNLMSDQPLRLNLTNPPSPRAFYRLRQSN